MKSFKDWTQADVEKFNGKRVRPRRGEYVSSPAGDYLKQVGSTMYEARTANADCQLSNAKQCERPQALEVSGGGETQGARCPSVCFTLRRVKLLDVDAKYASVKDLLDGLAYAGLIHGDKEGQINLEVRQEKVGSYDEEKTVIQIEQRECRVMEITEQMTEGKT